LKLAVVWAVHECYFQVYARSMRVSPGFAN
jgi:hypothetical protein